jgi:hypothetical protein
MAIFRQLTVRVAANLHAYIVGKRKAPPKPQRAPVLILSVLGIVSVFRTG